MLPLCKSFLTRATACGHSCPASPVLGWVAQSVQRLATGWAVRGSNLSEGEIFRTCPDQPRGPPSLLYNGYRVFPGGKERPGHDADPLTSSQCRGHERIELYLYSPYGPYSLYRASVPVQGCNLPLSPVLFSHRIASVVSHYRQKQKL